MTPVMPPLVVQPDAEALVVAALGHLPGVSCWAYAANPIDPDWVYVHEVQVDVRAGRKKEARDLAERVRQVMVTLPFAEWREGVVSVCRPVSGPFWLPDDDGSPRYVTRYEIRVHPQRRAASRARPRVTEERE